MEAEACAERFLWCFARYHWWPDAITSDRGSNSKHGVPPQTDGGPERMNQEVQAYLRAVINQNQNDWDKWVPAAQMALNGRFLVTEAYAEEYPQHSPETRAKKFVTKLQQITDLCQASMATATQQQERFANRRRNAAERFEVGDKVWLDLRNYASERPKKKFDWLHAKYTISKVLDPYTVELADLPRGCYNRFHVDQLRRAGRTQCLVSNAQTLNPIYPNPTWTSLDNMQQTAALDKYEQRYGPALENDGPYQHRRVATEAQPAQIQGQVEGIQPQLQIQGKRIRGPLRARTNGDAPEGQKRDVLLGLPRLVGPHSGENIAAYLKEVIDRYELGSKLGYFMLDNAKSNDTCLETLARWFPMDVSRRRLRCIGHVRVANHSINSTKESN
ncbi:uncharacterized protein HRG_07397 [Hirsutella rhossiliensis]|uniref:Integrase catalytic domain-containing protein n=1 Tax=Hirsutella rhossiliensis TaxID=111463 RepID=A0A9P8MVS8_9HYPO|nr:uncharacterized protein HRG_07397 [Hirsutella rhossiliensis]KAH0961319.1 hypothetical protein HRG_07397 [Hirsutella rhossiliensis]